ncbi:ABC transporter permease [Oceanotoga sp. DSM 15011]|uniref:NitT/TauT family transport system permease protein n=1 Tax=Oceanotoga teriensis TaxID=515440 RepID=A0AA45C4F7_9BACT|nr:MULTISPECIES: ABC transporter permease [Oceanotoga]PWJ85142.1 NitT/TauT family transport system permease protein [Oceanotoga teriensis]UYO99210.1 ABC transporter permease [Oceanotoga sp. DSM 15011]
MMNFIIKFKNNKYIYSILGVAIFLFLWQFFSSFYKPIILPSPLYTFETLLSMIFQKDTWYNIWLSFLRLFAGYFLSMILGTFLGFFMGLNEKINMFFNPMIVMLQTTPNISWILIAIIWFGLNSKIVVFTILISILPIFVINTREGVKSTDEELLQMSYVYKFSDFRRFTHIYLPSVKPYIASASIITIERGWKIGAMAELLSLDTGIGAGLYWARNNLQTEKIFAWTIILVSLGYISSMILKKIIKKFI